MGGSWDHLRFFLALARTGSLQGAGQREGVSHTTVFRRVRRFEAELATTLFDRTPDGWTLTEAGARVLFEAERMEASMQTIAQDLGGIDDQVAGPVTVAVGEALALTVLPALLHRLLERHPGLEIDLRVGRDLVDLVRRDADLAVRFTGRPPPSMRGRRLGQSGLVACASPAYVESRGVDFPTAVEGHRWIVVKAHKPPSWDTLQLDRHPEAVLFVDCFVTAVELCRRGLGITEVPDFLVDGDPGLLRLADAPSRHRAPVWLLVHPDLRDVARIRVVADALFDGLRPVFE